MLGGATIGEAAVTWARSHPALKERLRKALRAVGYETTDWMRIVMYRRCFAFIADLGPETLDTLEISAGPNWAREFRFRSYTGTSYPGFDICSQTLPARFDLIIADQVLEHLKWPGRVFRHHGSIPGPGASLAHRLQPLDGGRLVLLPAGVRVRCSRDKDGFLGQPRLPEGQSNDLAQARFSRVAGQRAGFSAGRLGLRTAAGGSARAARTVAGIACRNQCRRRSPFSDSGIMGIL
jgi:hypothetical protein